MEKRTLIINLLFLIFLIFLFVFKPSISKAKTEVVLLDTSVIVDSTSELKKSLINRYQDKLSHLSNSKSILSSQVEKLKLYNEKLNRENYVFSLKNKDNEKDINNLKKQLLDKKEELVISQDSTLSSNIKRNQLDELLNVLKTKHDFNVFETEGIKSKISAYMHNALYLNETFFTNIQDSIMAVDELSKYLVGNLITSFDTRKVLEKEGIVSFLDKREIHDIHLEATFYFAVDFSEWEFSGLGDVIHVIIPMPEVLQPVAFDTKKFEQNLKVEGFNLFSNNQKNINSLFRDITGELNAVGEDYAKSDPILNLAAKQINVMVKSMISTNDAVGNKYKKVIIQFRGKKHLYEYNLDYDNSNFEDFKYYSDELNIKVPKSTLPSKKIKRVII